MGLGLDVPPSSLGGVFVNAVVREHAISFSNSAYDYRKVASSNMSCLEAHTVLASTFLLRRSEGSLSMQYTDKNILDESY